jgi:hypothetical protein
MELENFGGRLVGNIKQDFHAMMTVPNEAVELTVFGAWVFPPTDFYDFAVDLLPVAPVLRQSPCAPVPSNPRSPPVSPVCIYLYYALHNIAAIVYSLLVLSSARAGLSFCYTLCPQSTVLLSASASRITRDISPRLFFTASSHTGSLPVSCPL